MRQVELIGSTFACLEGCGFCCTFQPEVNGRELGLLRRRLQPKPVPVAVGSDGRSYLRLQNGCGACTLLERRSCQVYDERPAHCRYFPFHLHFAEESEAYLNYTCRGVVRDAQGDLRAAFAQNVLANARTDDIKEHERLARDAYGAFKRLARRADAWGDADATAARLLEQGAALFTATGLRALAKGAGLDEDVDALHREALTPFGADEITQRPFYLAPDLRWLTFDHEGDDALVVLEMDEKGGLAPTGKVGGVGGWQDLSEPLAEALLPYLRSLVARRIFAGSVYAIVDDNGYATTVEEATHARLAEIVCDLALRARILPQLGAAPDSLADETARFYDSTFLDAPTIGGFL